MRLFQFGWFETWNDSTRNYNLACSVIAKFFTTKKFQFWYPGSYSVLLPRLLSR